MALNKLQKCYIQNNRHLDLKQLSKDVDASERVIANFIKTLEPQKVEQPVKAVNQRDFFETRTKNGNKGVTIMTDAAASQKTPRSPRNNIRDKSHIAKIFDD